MNLARLTLVSASTLLSVSLLAGCGGGTTPEQPRPSATATTLPSASPAPSPSLTTGSTISSDAIIGELLDAMQEARTMRGTTLTNGKETATTELVFENGTTNSHSKLATELGEIEIISLRRGEERFLRAPAVGVSQWAKMDANSSDPTVAQLSAQLGSNTTLMDPTLAIKIYEDAEDFTVAGAETVNGIETTKFTSSMPTAALMKHLGIDSSGTGDEKVALEIFADKDFRPIRTEFSGTILNQETVGVQNFSDFGADITITAP